MRHQPTRLGAALALTFLALAWRAPAQAQVLIEKRRPAAANGEVSIHNDFGTVTVRGWDRREVLVRGTLAAAAEGIDLEGEKLQASIDVSVPDQWLHSTDDSNFGSKLEIFVPAASSLSVETVNATVDVEGVGGEVEIETINGAIRLGGPLAAGRVTTLTGRVQIQAAGAPIEVSSISGAVTVQAAGRQVAIETISAPIDIAGAGVHEVQLKTTSGTIAFRGSFARAGEMAVETFSGAVTLIVPGDTRAHFDLKSFSGEIKSALGAVPPPVVERFLPYRRLRFATGVEAFEVRVETHDANITLAVE